VLQDERPPPGEEDDAGLVDRQARETALAHLEGAKARGEILEEDDDSPGTEREGRGGGEWGARNVSWRRRRQEWEMDRRGTLRWSGADARRELSVESDDDPFDIHAPAWRGRLTPIDEDASDGEGGGDDLEGGDRAPEGTRRGEKEEETISALPPESEKDGGDRDRGGKPAVKRRRGRPRKNTTVVPRK